MSFWIRVVSSRLARYWRTYPDRVVWVELTAGEYEAAVADPEVARQLAAYAGAILARRVPTAGEYARD
jgi:hypothetical protein